MENILLLYKESILNNLKIDDKPVIVFTIELVNDQIDFFKESDKYIELKDQIIKYWTVNSEGFTLNMVSDIADELCKSYEAKWDSEILLDDDIIKISYYVDKDINFKHIEDYIINHIDNILTNWI